MFNFCSEGLAIKNLGEKNKAAAAKWNAMDDEGKHQYHQLAAQLPIVTPDLPVYDKWHETQRVLTNMQDNVCHALLSVAFIHILSFVV